MKKEDKINRPAHYTLGKIECIDVIDQLTEDLSGKSGFYVGQIIKYVWRWYRKNGIEDLKKAQWYLTRLIKHLERK